MKLFLTIGMIVFFVSCAPGDETTPDMATIDRSAVQQSLAEDQERGTLPTEDLETTKADSHFETGQTLYVAAYSHVYFGHEKRQFNLACTLSIRNVDTRSPIILTAVDYHNTAGNLVRPFVDQPRTLAPLETVDFYIKERDTTGGSGANFIVRWGSPTVVNAPVVEAVMIGVAEGQGISFVCPAREITE